MGKSLNDNPFNSLGGFNINGIGISQEAIEENKKALGQVSEVKSEEELQANVSEYIKEDIKENKNISDSKKDLLKQMINANLSEAKEEIKKKKTTTNDDLKKELEMIQQREEETQRYTILKEDNKKVVSDTPKERTTKKTYIIKDEYIEIIEGLHILKDMEIKEVVNQLLGKAINDLGEDTITKAKKSYKNKDKGNNNLF